MDSKESGRHWENNAENWSIYTRKGCDIHRDYVNTPGFFSILPDVKGLVGLDVGCGEGHNTRLLVNDRGAKMSACDIAPTFIKYANDHEQQQPVGIDYQVADAQQVDDHYTAGSFDFVTSFMCLMDLPDQPRVFDAVYKLLKPGGFLQFSIIHPCFMSSPKSHFIKDENGLEVEMRVLDYFTVTNGEYVERWSFGISRKMDPNVEPFSVPVFHRPLSTWVSMILSAGFIIEQMHEPKATDEGIVKHPRLKYTHDICPIFLIFRVRKPTTDVPKVTK
ncbi:hypothetical protein SAMD00019534_070660 [Acytostelium subglobosum LB1]|uniref:hypothetical protein n=1 Tax=Acytostelium subglobosum LB1 TaxID=1410327 RepID=UPI000644EFFF|nr:hypothetical protein SAMD00019534_070660 [Acytostelium subglobosum LB1]GAM23891.1 hypothetical protein SAMD00019534_070660 [Acytostelium subglobosum LB1]|eukprot:XP_012752927.1 hypothetical protein SAMD00019534_070660 [Acytostelium subglobosum LB1]